MRPADERVEASKILQKVSRKDGGISMGCGDHSSKEAATNISVETSFGGLVFARLLL